MEKFFLTQIKQTNSTFEKGCVIKDTIDAVKQSYHAYLGAYAYGNNAETNYVSCYVSDISGAIILSETWNNIPISTQTDGQVSDNSVGEE